MVFRILQKVIYDIDKQNKIRRVKKQNAKWEVDRL